MFRLLKRHGGLIISLLFIGSMTFIFSWLLEKQHNPNQSNLVRVLETGDREVVLRRNRSGHYVASGEINGETVRFFLDTGATHVSVPERIANELALQRGRSMIAQTAGGLVEVFSTRLDEVRLGHIVMENVPASINPGMVGEDILLGMSFLGHLEMLQRGDTLSLRVPIQ